MGTPFKAGEKKARPGIYRRYEKRDTGSVAGASYGNCAITIKADNGPMGKVTVHEKPETLIQMYGTGQTTNAALKMFDGGASRVYVCRLGTGGTNGTMNLMDTTVDTAVEVVGLTLKYPGTYKVSVSVREKHGDDNNLEFVVYEGTKVVEALSFEKGDAQPQGLVDAINSSSAIFTAVKLADGNGIVALTAQNPITPGTNPTVTNEDYSDAFALLEAFKWNTISVDSVKSDVHMLLHAFLKRIYQSGALGIGVVGEDSSVTFDTRKINASRFNDILMTYVGNGFLDLAGNKIEGYEAAAYTAAVIASTPSSRSIVHSVAVGGIDVLENLTNSQYEDAINHGMLMFSMSGNGQIWFDSGVDTLVVPADDQDDGWKKIRRMSTRFELFDRIERTTAPIVGKVNCDSVGIGDFIKLAQKVIDAMISEGKLAKDSIIYSDPDQVAAGDSAWFIIDADDIDSLEKIYLTYRFRFMAN